ncbi:MAG: hypothetical protein HFI70_11855 [Lachnospiraceae bacterium]|nr:hypothetical protein [Lachnospiraceae bacterium]
MSTILQQLYSGKICPAEQYRPLQESYRKMRSEHCSHYTDFIKRLEQLDPPLDKRFIEIMDEQLDTIPLDFSSMFIDGFCLGAQMMIEILSVDRISDAEDRR